MLRIRLSVAGGLAAFLVTVIKASLGPFAFSLSARIRGVDRLLINLSLKARHEPLAPFRTVVGEVTVGAFKAPRLPSSLFLSLLITIRSEILGRLLRGTLTPIPYRTFAGAGPVFPRENTNVRARSRQGGRVP